MRERRESRVPPWRLGLLNWKIVRRERVGSSGRDEGVKGFNLSLKYLPLDEIII